MNRFYRKPKPETMQKNREFYADAFKVELIWLKDNFGGRSLNTQEKKD